MLALLASTLFVPAEPEFVVNGRSLGIHPTKNLMAFVRPALLKGSDDTVEMWKFEEIGAVRDLDTGEEQKVVEMANRKLHLLGWDDKGDSHLVFVSPMEWAPEDYPQREFAALNNLTKADADFEHTTEIYTVPLNGQVQAENGVMSDGTRIAKFANAAAGYSHGANDILWIWASYSLGFPYNKEVSATFAYSTEKKELKELPVGRMIYSADKKYVLVFSDGGLGLVNNASRKQSTIVKKITGSGAVEYSEPDSEGVKTAEVLTATEAAISRDGKKIAYLLEKQRWEFNTESKELFQIVTSTELHLLDSAARSKAVIARDLAPTSLAFSPDASHLYFVEQTWSPQPPKKSVAPPHRIFRIAL